MTNTNAGVGANAATTTGAGSNTSSDKMGEKEYVTDLLNSEKLLCSTYNTAIIEAATPQIREDFKSVLMDQFDVQNTIFMAMNEKGWYPVDPAQQNKIQQAKDQYPSSVLNA
ncbi:MAG TPA: spore coat protein [Clostridiales bacterium]|nr:spore coat protein [Clostridiales bacterium]